MQSNSLYPYELIDVARSDPAADGASAQLVLRLKRGDKTEDMAVHVERREGGKYGLKAFSPA